MIIVNSISLHVNSCFVDGRVGVGVGVGVGVRECVRGCARMR